MAEHARRPASPEPFRALTRRGFLGGAAGATGAAVLGTALPAAAHPARPRGAARLIQQGDLPRGGTLRAAIGGEPPVLADAMFTTAEDTAHVAQQMFEGLFALDSQYAAKPMLADGHTIGEDGLTHTFALRQGVTFHNGQPLTATDVVASLNRWGALSADGKRIYARVDQVQAVDPATVAMTFTEPTGLLLDFLAQTPAFVLPAAIAEAAATTALTDEQLVGTGPFRFAEHRVDQFIRFERFDGYVPRSEAADGAAGRKVAYLDAVEIIPVPDASVRADGLITGEYHFADAIEPDQYDTINDDPNLAALIVKPSSWCAVNLNKAQGLFTDVRLRQAVALAFSAEEALISAFGRPEFYRVDPGVAAQETVWHSDAGNDLYLRDDPERARALLAEAGYAGQPVRWLTTREYPYHYNTGALVAQRLGEIGMPVELVVSDWSTLVENRANPEGYEALLMAHSGYAHPATLPFNDPTWPGYWESPERDRLIDAMLAEADVAAQVELVDQYQQLIYDELPFVKCGDFFGFRATTADVEGYQNLPDWFFWNVGLTT